MNFDELAPGQGAYGFVLQSSEQMPEIDGTAIVMRHEASGARLLFLRNDDENKAFCITFRTPPEDSTGVFHILEHSVLCGSRRYPVKEPFVNLLKTSMQTFLNAMTFPDKTMYPVASTNQRDLMNLMDVYMDAVLHPAIYEKRTIFQQEGWHLELDEVDAPLRYNGVVFNEMKGALSDPDSVLLNGINASLFPGTCYAFESGGHPRVIPSLTYEKFLEMHARHYRLDNSYIILYGNLDADEVLGHLDENYLCPEANDTLARSQAAGEPNEIAYAEPCIEPDLRIPMATAPENATMGLGYVIGRARDYERVLACDILMDALMGGNESPLKRALLDAGIAGDARGYLIDGQAQPVLLFQLKNVAPGAAERFRGIILEEAGKLVEEGIPRDLLEASLAQMAFDLRERDRGMADGIPLAMNAMSGWLYEEDLPTAYLRYEDALAHMREGLEDGYFERVLSDVVLGSDHWAQVQIIPDDEVGDGGERAELDALAQGMDQEAREQVMADVAALRLAQETPDSPEDLATLPYLSVDEIGEGRAEVPIVDFPTVPAMWYHGMHTRRIDYVSRYINLNFLTWDDLPYASILGKLLGNLDTAEHTAAELDIHIRRHLGGLSFGITIQNMNDDMNMPLLQMVVSSCAIAEEVQALADIPREVYATTSFDDKDRIHDLLVQRRIHMEHTLVGAGHAVAKARVASYFGKGAMVSQAMGGIDFYLFLKDLLDNYDERFPQLKARLEVLRDRIFEPKPYNVISFTGEPDDQRAFLAAKGAYSVEEMKLAVAARDRGEKQAENNLWATIPEPQVRNEAFIVPGDVVYTASGADLSPAHYSGAWAVLGHVLGYDYLWNEVRVKGGAYGTGFGMSASGLGSFYSYRDPGVDGTLRRFADAGSWLSNLELDPKDMDGYIVSTVAGHDAPLKPKQIASMDNLAAFIGRPKDYRSRLRSEMLSCTVDELRSLADSVTKAGAGEAFCTVGNEGVIRGSKAPYGSIVKLF